MNVLETLVHTPAAAALGRTLLHSLWEGALIALALVVALSVLRSSRARYAAACLAMLGMLAAFGVTFTWSLPQGLVTVVKTVPGMAGASGFNAGSLRQPDAPRIAAEWLSWLAPFWVAGVLSFHARSIALWMAARRMTGTGVCLAADNWQQRLQALRERMQVTRPVVLLESCLAEVPVVIGHLRPVVLVPAGLLAGMPAAHVEAILLHELAHIRRHDYLTNLLQHIAESLLFYHPAAWWISSTIRAEREHCCDDVAAAAQGSVHEYAHALAALEHRRAPQAAMAASGGSLVKRIRRLLAKPEQPSAALAAIATAAVLTLTVFTATAWQSKAQQPGPQPRAPYQKWLNEDVTYIITDGQKWLNQDVAYIITNEERAAYKQLRSDAERERFIELFWLQRDPTSSTVVNEFKEEHYRRIAYANERFTASVPGWKTDRGRIYIIYGPPDEIESHPSGGNYRTPDGRTITTFPFEQWRYKWIEGIGHDAIIEFVDRTGKGEYHQTFDPSEKDSSRVPRAAAQFPTTLRNALVGLWQRYAGWFNDAGASEHVAVQRIKGRQVRMRYTGVVRDKQNNVWFVPGELTVRLPQ